MSKMRCKCGNILSNVDCPCSTEGWLAGDQDREQIDRDFTHQVGQFLEAVREGVREEWIVQHFDVQYPQELPDAAVISDILSICEIRRSLSVAECPSCGRLHVQKEPGLNEYLIFAPEEPGYHQVLVRSG